MKVGELSGAKLNHWVAIAEGMSARGTNYVAYSTSWSVGGPLIDKYKLCVGEADGEWICVGPDTDYRSSMWSMLRDSDGVEASGTTALEAVCRAVVMMKFGDEVDAPQTYQQEK